MDQQLATFDMRNAISYRVKTSIVARVGNQASKKDRTAQEPVKVFVLRPPDRIIKLFGSQHHHDHPVAQHDLRTTYEYQQGSIFVYGLGITTYPIIQVVVSCLLTKE
ncbi:MAG: hypothetical protein J3Q66DRAFT_400972 [Benniella sp.]|nr:MAG: hypothetical protein J3Q66DRAFT_400972 [Benniella sp.]